MVLHKLRKFWLKVRSDESGSIVALVAAAMVMLLGLAALGADAGRLYIEKQRLSTAADAAVLAGVQALPDFPDTAVNLTREYLQKNGIDPDSAVIEVSADKHEIGVRMGDSVTMGFAKVFGTDQVSVNGGAGAVTGAVSAYYGAAPMGVPQADWQIGDLVYLKVGSGDATTGNYQALALGDGGASAYEANLQNGYNGLIKVGDWIATEPGNMAGPTVRAVNYLINSDPYATFSTVKRNSPRILVVPILASSVVNGRGEVSVIGFGVFYLETGVMTGSDKGEVRGRFMRAVVNGGTTATAPDFGARVIKLKH